MKIILSDDHALFRTGMRSVLTDVLGSDLEILEAEDYQQTVSLLASHADVDLVLCDLIMPGMNEFDGLKQLVKAAAKIPVVVVSGSEDPSVTRRAIGCGAKGYIFKHQTFEVLHRALELVLAGAVYVPIEAVIGPEDGAQAGADRTGQGGRSGPGGALLTRRQAMIFEQLAEGRSNKEIGRSLNIAEGTVKAQVRTIFRKLGVRNRTEAALLANRRSEKDWPKGPTPRRLGM